jgi:hypothetical protein
MSSSEGSSYFGDWTVEPIDIDGIALEIHHISQFDLHGLKLGYVETTLEQGILHPDPKPFTDCGDALQPAFALLGAGLDVVRYEQFHYATTKYGA